MNVHEPITREDDPRFVDAVKGITRLAYDRPFGGFKVINVDPPWFFSNWSLKGAEKAPLKHYPCMSTELLAKLPIGDLAGNDCAMFMWSCWPLIYDTQPLISSWGFDYSGLAWEWRKVNPKTGKAAFGGGYGTRKNLEPCLLARRGAPKLKTRSERDYLEAPRREHSRKPDEAYEKIQRMFDGPYIDVFARERRNGWTVWGNETEKFAEAVA